MAAQESELSRALVAEKEELVDLACQLLPEAEAVLELLSPLDADSLA